MMRSKSKTFKTMQDYDNFDYNNNILSGEEKEKEIKRINRVFKPNLLRAHMKTAYNYSNVSYAKRLNVGALTVSTDGSMLCGYNGMISGFPNECEYHNEDKTRIESLHAESNTVTKAAHSPVKLKNATLFVTHINCIECAKIAIQSGIRRVVYEHVYRLDEGLKLLVAKGVQVIQVDMSKEPEKQIINIFNKFTPEMDAEMFYLLNYIEDNV